jgi:BlaI family transcriptional regulator, penicillinase repressor
MEEKKQLHLSRRERQIMDVLYRRGHATAAEVHQDLPNRPSYSAVRAMLRTLEEKGHLSHEAQGPRYIYRPTVSIERAKRSALRHLLETFFEGSAEQAVAALVEGSAAKLSQQELDRLSLLIEEAKRKGA